MILTILEASKAQVKTLQNHDVIRLRRIILKRVKLILSIRKMALDGYCLNLDLPQLRRMAYLLQNCSSNLNQIAKRANESNKIYSADLADLRTRLDELIDIGRQILSKLAEL